MLGGEALFLDRGGAVNLDGGSTLCIDAVLDSVGAALAWSAVHSRGGDAMDLYLIGRILGMLYWPALVAVVLLSLGWAVAMPRPPHIAVNIKRWFRVAALVAFTGTLFFTSRDFLKYTGVFS